MSLQGVVDDSQTKLITITTTPPPSTPAVLNDTILVVGSVVAVALGVILAAYEMAKKRR